MWYKVNKIRVGTQQVRPSGWTPTSNTLVYYPLTASSTVNDLSGNNRNLTKYWSCTFWTYQWVSCLYLPWSESSYLKYNWDSGSYYNFTMSFYYYCMDVWNWSNILYSNDNWVFVNPNNQPRFSWANNIPNTPSITNSWKHIVCVANWSVAKIYINGVAYSWNWQTSRSISTVVEVSWTGSGHSSKWYVSNVIIESKARTDAEVLNYYNQTKSNYWL